MASIANNHNSTNGSQQPSQQQQSAIINNMSNNINNLTLKEKISRGHDHMENNTNNHQDSNKMASERHERERERQQAIVRPKPKELDGYVGFANLPNQVYRKAVKRGFDFTLMVVGKLFFFLFFRCFIIGFIEACSYLIYYINFVYGLMILLNHSFRDFFLLEEEEISFDMLDANQIN